MAKRDNKREDLMLGAKLGLFDEKHRREMGKAIWLFLPMQALTQLNGGDGHIEFSQPEIIGIAQDEWGFSERTAYRYFRRLVEEEYLRPREDGTWEITKYENFKMFLERKKEFARSGKGSAKTDRSSARSGKKIDKTGKGLGSKPGLRVIRDIREIGEGESPLSKEEELTDVLSKGMGQLREICARRGDKLGRGVTSRDAKDLKAMLEDGYSLEDIFECYEDKLHRRSNQGSHVPLDWVRRDIGYWLQERGPSTQETLNRLPDLLAKEV